MSSNVSPLNYIYVIAISFVLLASIKAGYYGVCSKMQMSTIKRVFLLLVGASALYLLFAPNVRTFLPFLGKTVFPPSLLLLSEQAGTNATVIVKADGAEKVAYYTPYLLGDKFDILKDGEKCCEYLHLNFDKVYSYTNTSYKPLKHKIEYNNATETWYEEEWFSDYKSASSVERVEAFIKLGRKDPVAYADEQGPVSWEYVVEQVTKTLNDHETSKS